MAEAWEKGTIMKRLATGVMMACMITASSVATAAEDYDTGNYILNGCEVMAEMKPLTHDPELTFKMGICHGAINAMTNMMVRDGDLCPPSNNGSITNSQTARIVSKYMEDHPAELNRPYTQLLFDALNEAWPCKTVK